MFLQFIFFIRDAWSFRIAAIFLVLLISNSSSGKESGLTAVYKSNDYGYYKFMLSKEISQFKGVDKMECNHQTRNVVLFNGEYDNFVKEIETCTQEGLPVNQYQNALIFNDDNSKINILTSQHVENIYLANLTVEYFSQIEKAYDAFRDNKTRYLVLYAGSMSNADRTKIDAFAKGKELHVAYRQVHHGNILKIARNEILEGVDVIVAPSSEGVIDKNNIRAFLTMTTGFSIPVFGGPDKRFVDSGFFGGVYFSAKKLARLSQDLFNGSETYHENYFNEAIIEVNNDYLRRQYDVR